MKYQYSKIYHLDFGEKAGWYQETGEKTIRLTYDNKEIIGVNKLIEERLSIEGWELDNLRNNEYFLMRLK